MVCFSAGKALAFLLTLVCILCGAQAQIGTLKAACQVGVPPFTDGLPRNTPPYTACDGVFFEIFDRACRLQNIAYTMEYITDDTFDDRLTTVNNITQKADFDVVVSFHSITPTRLQQGVDFSIALYETSYKLALLEKFHTNAGSITDSVIRDSVMYTVSIMGVMIAIYALVILLFESTKAGSEVSQQPPWRRLLWSYEQAFETVVTGGTSLDISHQVTRTFRTLVGYMGFFIVNIFGALITSNLTAAALGAADPTIADIRGAQIAVGSRTLQSYLDSLPVGAKATDMTGATGFVGGLEGFAELWYADSPAAVSIANASGIPAAINLFDGIAAPTDEINWLHDRFGGTGKGFTMSTEFTLTGSPDLKAIPFSVTVDPKVKDAFDLGVQRLRDDGVLAEIFATLPAGTSPSNDDFPVPEGAKTAMYVVCGVGFSFFLLAAFVMFLARKLKGKPAKKFSVYPYHDDEEEEEEDVAAGGDEKEKEEPAAALKLPTDDTFEIEWKGATVRLPHSMKSIIDHITLTSSVQEL